MMRFPVSGFRALLQVQVLRRALCAVRPPGEAQTRLVLVLVGVVPSDLEFSFWPSSLPLPPIDLLPSPRILRY